MVLPLQRLRECREIGLHDFEPSSIVLGERVDPAHDVERCLSFRTCLGEDQRALGEIEREESYLARNRGPGRFPSKASRDHQVKDEEQVSFRLEDNPFAEPPKADEFPSLDARERRVHRTQEKGIGESDSCDSPPDESRFQRVQIQQDVRELRHGSLLPCCTSARVEGCRNEVQRRLKGASWAHSCRRRRTRRPQNETVGSPRPYAGVKWREKNDALCGGPRKESWGASAPGWPSGPDADVALVRAAHGWCSGIWPGAIVLGVIAYIAAWILMPRAEGAGAVTAPRRRAVRSLTDEHHRRRVRRPGGVISTSNPTLVRLSWVILSVVAGAVVFGIVAYLVAWLIIPPARVATLHTSPSTT